MPLTRYILKNGEFAVFQDLVLDDESGIVIMITASKNDPDHSKASAPRSTRRKASGGVIIFTPLSVGPHG